MPMKAATRITTRLRWQCASRLAERGAHAQCLEFGGYHDPDGSGRIVNRRLPARLGPGRDLAAQSAEQARKRQALACYRTQTRIAADVPP